MGWGAGRSGLGAWNPCPAGHRCHPHTAGHVSRSLILEDIHKSTRHPSWGTGMGSENAGYSCCQPIQSGGLSWAWWRASVIPAQERLRQEDCLEFEASLSYVVSSRPP